MDDLSFLLREVQSMAARFGVPRMINYEANKEDQ